MYAFTLPRWNCCGGRPFGWHDIVTCQRLAIIIIIIIIIIIVASTSDQKPYKKQQKLVSSHLLDFYFFIYRNNIGNAQRFCRQARRLHGVTNAAGFMRVEPVKMTGDDGHWYGECQHAGNGARSTNQFADVANGYLVSVADRRHGNDGPPERVRDAVDLRSRLT